jgi:hypothetical protein
MLSLLVDMTLTHLEIGFEKGRKRNRKEDKTISKAQKIVGKKETKEDIRKDG